MPDLLEDEYRGPFTAWKADRSPQASTQMLRAVQPVIDTAVRAYGGGIPTLRSRAKGLALDALGSYDPSRGKLKNHLLTHLQRLQREALQSRQIIQAPERVVLDQMKLNAAQTEFEDQFGRPPSDQELSDFASISLGRIQHVRRASRPLAEGQATRESDSDEATDFTPATSALYRDYRPMLQFIYDDLNPTDQWVLERLEGLNGHRRHSPGEIAALLKVTPAAISQRMTRIQGEIDKLMQLEEQL